MKYLFLIFFFLGVLSCNPNGFPIWPGGDDPTPTPIDTIIVPIDTLPLVLDTCDSYADIVSTKFSTWAINLDGIFPTGYQFYYQTYGGQFIPIDIDTYLNQYGVSKTYYSGINICGIVTGLDNPSFTLNHTLYVFDLFGNVFNIQLQPYLFNFQGALTYDQLFAELVLHSNFHYMAFFNVSLTQDQINELMDYLIDNCISGIGNTINFRHLPPGIIVDNDRRGLLDLAGFTILP